MQHATTQHADPAHDAGHGHDEVETPETKAERERSAAVQDAMALVLARRAAPAMIIAGAGLSLALLSMLGPSAPPQAWLWLLPSILLLGWGLSLRR